MMTTPFSLPWSMRLALARISVTVVPGVSSIMMSSAERVVVASRIFSQSCGLILAERMSCRLICAYEDRRRCAISTELISSEKSATEAPEAAAWAARFSANEVLPTPGRAPMTTIWPGRRPSSLASMPGNPVFTPKVCSWLWHISPSSL
jgi:hypothetical protein